MKLAPFIWILLFSIQFSHAVELIPLAHRLVESDDRTFVREKEDRRYSVWTSSTDKAKEILKEFGLKKEKITLEKGEVFAVFLNDQITEDLVQITFNKTNRQYFADYADSGIEFKLRRAPAGKKYTHVTAVVFTPTTRPSHLGLRSMVSGGLSEHR